MKWIFLSLTLVFSSMAGAQDLGSELDALGGNEALMEKARAMSPKNRVRIVQNRAVDRSLRIEFGMTFTQTSGGDAYLTTSQMGGLLDFHITPRWSLGVRHNSYSNSFNNEGERRYEQARARKERGLEWEIPETDAPQSDTMAVISFYPVYGKLNLFDLTVAQFDLYTLAGAGQMKLVSGSSDTWTAGVGAGIWLNKYFSTRLEARYQSYQDTVRTGPRNQDMTLVTATLGFLL